MPHCGFVFEDDEEMTDGEEREITLVLDPVLSDPDAFRCPNAAQVSFTSMGSVRPAARSTALAVASPRR